MQGSAGKSIGQVAYRKPLARCGMEELAARQNSLASSTGGVAFARRVDGDGKMAARQMVIDLVMNEKWSERVHILTTPGVEWRFERKLLGAQQPGWTRHTSPLKAYFTACESDRAIFYAGVTQMPGLHTPGSELKRIKPYPFAEMGVKTRYASYFFANIDEFMAAGGWAHGWDVAWLDYTGPLTTERLALIKKFYADHVRHFLIVTALKARFNKAAMNSIERAGGYWKWLRKNLPGEIMHEHEYFDTSAMAQFAIRRPAPPTL